jgi:hypothetical protein
LTSRIDFCKCACLNCKTSRFGTNQKGKVTGSGIPACTALTEGRSKRFETTQT